jgi:hypothetical protein
MGGNRRTTNFPVRRGNLPPDAEEPRRPTERQVFWKRKPIASAVSIGGMLIGILGGINILAESTERAMPIVSSFMPKDLPKAEAPANPVLPTTPVAGYLGGWGPERQTFTEHLPADHAVLNSITDQVVQGDERNFVQIKRATQPGATRYADNQEAKPGDRVTVYAWVENDAADNVPGVRSTVHGLTARFVSGRLSDGRLTAGVVYDGKDIASAWDGATVKIPGIASLQFINGSIRFLTNHSPEGGFVVPDGEFAAGKPVPVGETALDGEFPVGKIDGKGSGSGYLLFDMLVTGQAGS